MADRRKMPRWYWRLVRNRRAVSALIRENPTVREVISRGWRIEVIERSASRG